MTSNRLFHYASVLLMASLPGFVSSCGNDVHEVAYSVADLQVVHVGVSLGDSEVLQERRVGDGEKLSTKPEGRARLRLDDGSVVVVDGATQAVMTRTDLKVESGRLFVIGSEATQQIVAVGGSQVMAKGAQFAIDARTEPKRIYAASGELTIRKGDKDHRVQTGETAVLAQDAINVEPERAFDDWTGGLLSPWGAKRRVVGELRGCDPNDRTEAGSPLAMRGQDVRVRLDGESALTEVATTYFHAGDAAVRGDFKMQLPADAIVTGFAAGFDGALREGHISRAGPVPSADVSQPLLEWAGDSWVRGVVPLISPGQSVRLVVRFTQWLTREASSDGVHFTYRLPLSSPDPSIVIGEFSLLVDASELKPKRLRTSHSGSVDGDTVRMTRSEFRPNADYVLELDTDRESQPARVLTTLGDPADPLGSYILVRAETPQAQPTQGSRLVLVLDTSSSMRSGAWETATGFVSAILNLLGQNDELVVLSAGVESTPLGPPTLGKMDDQRRATIQKALETVRPSGASNLGVALTTAAELLGPSSAHGLVVYVGDGWPTVGELDPLGIRAQLFRSDVGAPRVAALAVGTRPNEFGLATILRGLGPVHRATDPKEASEAASLLLAEALRPAVASVRLDLGPGVEQVYPLHGQAAVSGQTIFAVGRTFAAPSREITLRWRDDKGEQSSTLATLVSKPIEPTHIRRWWARERIEELTARTADEQAAVDIALREQLLTPWTAWTLDGSTSHVATPIPTRMLEHGTSSSAILSAFVQRSSPTGFVAADLSSERSSNLTGEAGFKRAVALAGSRTLDGGYESIRACRDAVLALYPNAPTELGIHLQIDGSGKPDEIRVVSTQGVVPPSLDQCITVAVQGLSFPAMDVAGKIVIEHRVTFVETKSLSRTTCSLLSSVPVAARRGVWLARLQAGDPITVYTSSKRFCELQTWSAKRALLDLIMDHREGEACLLLAKQLDLQGERDASKYLRAEVLRRVTNPQEFARLRRLLVQGEAFVEDVFRKAYQAASSNEERLRVVQRHLRIAPHEITLQKLLIRLLVAIDNKQVLTTEAIRLRDDPLTDASLLAEVALAFRHLGMSREGRDALLEIAERAPYDPWARGYASDRLLAGGWVDASREVLLPLEEALATSQVVMLRSALVHAAADRTDLATRVFSRLLQTTAPSAQEDLSELSAGLSAVLLLKSLPQANEPEMAELARRLAQVPLRPSTAVIVRVKHFGGRVDATLERGPDAVRETMPPKTRVDELGLFRFEVEPGAEPLVLKIRMDDQWEPRDAVSVDIDTLTLTTRNSEPTWKRQTATLKPDGQWQTMALERGK